MLSFRRTSNIQSFDIAQNKPSLIVDSEKKNYQEKDTPTKKKSCQPHISVSSEDSSDCS